MVAPRTAIVLDWDDTLFPLTHVGKLSIPLRADGLHLALLIIKRASELGDVCKKSMWDWQSPIQFYLDEDLWFFLVRWWCCSFLLKLLKSSHRKIKPDIQQLVYPTNPIIFLRNKTPIIFALRIWEDLAFWGPILPCTSWMLFFFKSDSVQCLRHTKIVCDSNISPEILVLFVCVFFWWVHLTNGFSWNLCVPSFKQSGIGWFIWETVLEDDSHTDR